jgi:hypothetical protein
LSSTRQQVLHRYRQLLEQLQCLLRGQGGHLLPNFLRLLHEPRLKHLLIMLLALDALTQ